MIYLINRRLYNTITKAYQGEMNEGKFISDDQKVINWLSSRGIHGIKTISIKEF